VLIRTLVIMLIPNTALVLPVFLELNRPSSSHERFLVAGMTAGGIKE